MWHDYLESTLGVTQGDPPPGKSWLRPWKGPANKYAHSILKLKTKEKAMFWKSKHYIMFQTVDDNNKAKVAKEY